MKFVPKNPDHLMEEALDSVDAMLAKAEQDVIDAALEWERAIEHPMDYADFEGAEINLRQSVKRLRVRTGGAASLWQIRETQKS